MGAVSLTTVVSFEAVGAILVVAFLIVPPATAYLLTNSLPVMLILTVVFGTLSAATGYLLASAIDGSIAGAMAASSGFFFLLVFLFSPTQGVFRLRRKRMRPSEAPWPISE
jgi:manganese/zinc/iron transport system permease protein